MDAHGRTLTIPCPSFNNLLLPHFPALSHAPGPRFESREEICLLLFKIKIKTEIFEISLNLSYILIRTALEQS